MAEYRLSNTAKNDLIRIHQYGVAHFGVRQADRYFNAFFDSFEMIAQMPFAFESVEYIRPGYRRCVCGVDSILYRINGDFVEIMTIIGKQDMDQIL